MGDRHHRAQRRSSGSAGYPSLVQGSFFGGGAYISSLLLQHGHRPAVAAILGIVLTMVGALLIGIVFARTRGQYFAIGTLFSGGGDHARADQRAGRHPRPTGHAGRAGVGRSR